MPSGDCGSDAEEWVQQAGHGVTGGPLYPRSMALGGEGGAFIAFLYSTPRH